jgi:Bifunctional DNA primase/polymerase, N-terminal/Primase C terminal 1 (PriCT-1)
MLRTALKLAARGLHVFPCAPSAKTPACAHGCKDATTDSVVIQAWWRSCPEFNIGVATGPASAVFVIDIDGEDGEHALKQLEAAHTTLPATVEAITPRGRHVYFKWPQSPVCNTAGKLAKGVDSRGQNGYVLAPPSLHPSGRRYAWSVDSANAFAEAPQWLLDKITEPAKNGNGATPSSEWRELVTTGVEEGKRNEQLTKLTGHLLRRYVDAVVTLQLVQSWNVTHCRPPLPSGDVERIVNSIAGRELRKRTNGSGG